MTKDIIPEDLYDLAELGMGKEQIRAQCVIDFMNGYSIESIAVMNSVNDSFVCEWKDRYKNNGVNELYDQGERVKFLLSTTNWTYGKIAEHITGIGVKVDRSYVSKIANKYFDRPSLVEYDLGTLKINGSLDEQKRVNCIIDVINGDEVRQVADRYDISRQSVYNWLRKYRNLGVHHLEDGHPGRPITIDENTRATVVDLLLRTEWSSRKIAEHLRGMGIKISHDSVWRIAKAHLKSVK